MTRNDTFLADALANINFEMTMAVAADGIKVVVQVLPNGHVVVDGDVAELDKFKALAADLPLSECDRSDLELDGEIWDTYTIAA